jgi:DNA-binding beta-propeller fold protein YncE
VPVDDPYNLYFSPDGRAAMVIAEARHRIDFRDPQTMTLVQSTHVACSGLDHLDFTADLAFAIASCEFSGQLVKVDLATRQVVGYLRLPGKAMPQDIRASPDGSVFYVADMAEGGVHVIDPVALTEVNFVQTGVGAHGLVVAHGGGVFYVANRGWKGMAKGRRGPGSVSVLDPATQRVTATWPLPDGGSPDMGSVSTDGRQLWLSGRYDDEVYVLSTETGELLKRIRVGKEPHGLCYWPQPGRFSLGHTGNMR